MLPSPPYWTSFTMSRLEFKPFGDVRAEDFLPLVNDETVRKHLIDHPPFDAASVRIWMDDKIRIDMYPVAACGPLSSMALWLAGAEYNPTARESRLPLSSPKRVGGLGLPSSRR